jgi:two-component system response regulator DegU
MRNTISRSKNIKKNKISILVIEDNRLLREGLTAIVEEQSDLKVTAAIGDCEKALQSIRESEPNIVLLDIGLRNQNSLQLVKTINKNFLKIKVIVMDMVPVLENVLLFIQAGVVGFILKDANVNEFLNTIKTVAAGAKVLPPNLTESLFSQIIDKALIEDPVKIIDSIKMTRRERQVIELVSDGLANKEIAQKLHLSTHTVKSHIHNILEKLALHTRVQIAQHAHLSESYNTAIDVASLISE